MQPQFARKQIFIELWAIIDPLLNYNESMESLISGYSDAWKTIVIIKAMSVTLFFIIYEMVT